MALNGLACTSPRTAILSGCGAKGDSSLSPTRTTLPIAHRHSKCSVSTIKPYEGYQVDTARTCLDVLFSI